jgi:hypothetical protein
MRKTIYVMLVLASFVHAGVTDFQYISPAPASELNTCQSTIIIREGSLINSSSVRQDAIQLLGSKSGLIPGRTILARDGRTILFKPAHDLAANETVQVQMNTSICTVSGATLPSCDFSFRTAGVNIQLQPALTAKSFDTHSPSLQSTPPVPNISTVIYDSTALAEGKILLSWYGQLGLVFKGDPNLDAYIMVLNNDGSPYYMKNIGSTLGVGLVDFKMQPNGYFSYPKVLGSYQWTGGGEVKHMVLDPHFALIDSFQMGNGYRAETHDFRLLPNGHALLMAYYLIPVDMSKYVPGAFPNAMVDGAVVQELDADKNVIFQWRTWDYFSINLIPWKLVPNVTQQVVNVFHLNAISMDQDGQLLLGTPGMGLKINRQTGKIMWIIGGFMNQFTFQNVTAIEGNGDLGGHTFQRLKNGNILVYDNSPFPWQPGANSISAEAVEYKLDEQALTAEMVWKYTPSTFTPGWHAGSAQRLDNGNTLICWGGPPAPGNSLVMSEVTADGRKVMDLSFNSSDFESYRACRVKIDAGRPAASVTRAEVAPGNIYAFNNADTAVTGVRIKVTGYAGSGYNELTVKKYDFAPNSPEFFGKAPRVLAGRMVLTGFAIANLEGDIRFDTDIWEVRNPEYTLVYQREFENRGLFEVLETTYNHVTHEITAPLKGMGEFILGAPDLASVAFAPRLDSPADSSTVNQEYPVSLRWAPVGFANGHILQIAKDAAFTDLVLESPVLTTTLFPFQNAQVNTRYFWRVKSLNDAGESGWSAVYTFMPIPPMVQVVSPNGGEAWQRGLPYFIRWKSNFVDSVVLALQSDQGATTVLDTVANSSTWNWEIHPQMPTGNYKVLIKNVHRDTLTDVSNAYFSIIDTVATKVSTALQSAESWALQQNYPNPFNPVTHISFTLPVSEHANLAVFDLEGRQVGTLQDGILPAGSHTVYFDGRRLASGVYIYRLSTPSFMQIRKMMLLK